MTNKQKLLAASAALLTSVAVLATTATAQNSNETFSADTVSVENFIGRIEIRTGSSSQVSVTISNPGNQAEDPVYNQSGNRVEIDGGQRIRNLNCNNRNGQMRIGRRFSMHDIEDYPLLTITAPADIAFELSRSAFAGEAGDLGSLDLSMSSCGKFEGGDIQGEAAIRINGSGDVTLGQIGHDASVDINGSGDVVLSDIGGSASVDISGSGDVQTGSVTGDAIVGINGSGDVEFGEVSGLSVHISGSGDVEAQSLNGAFDTRISGSGDVQVHEGRAEPFEASINGSGDIRFGGTAVNVTVRETGGGDIHIDEIEGNVNWRRNGRTVLRVGGTD